MGLTFAAMDINQRKRNKKSWKRHFSCLKKKKGNKEDQQQQQSSSDEPEKNNRDTITLEDIQNVGKCLISFSSSL